MVRPTEKRPSQVLWTKPLDTDHPKTPWEICEAFEKAWLKGTPPEIREYLSYSEDSDPRPLLYGLMYRDKFYREKFRQPVSREDYLKQFPQEEALLNALFPNEEALQQLFTDSGYEDIRKIGNSRISGVYKVRQKDTQDICAATVIPNFFVRKSILDGSDKQPPDFSYLIHPNITRPSEIVAGELGLILVTRFEPGYNFRELCKRYGKPVPVEVACELSRQAAAGLNCFHEHFKAHGSLTPSNALFNPEAEDAEVVKLSSVGFADLADLRLTRLAMIPPHSQFFDWRLFEAPELLEKDRLADARSDVYSLGCTLFYILTGKSPIPRRNGTRNTKVPIHELCQHCPPNLEAVIVQMMSDVPEERPQTGADVVAALIPFAEPSALREFRKTLEQDEPSTDKPKVPFRVVKNGNSQPPTVTKEEAVQPAATDIPTTKSGKTRYLWLGLTSLALVALLVGVIYYLMQPRTREVPDWAYPLVELPGPSGDWWFEEMPWYAPSVRAVLLHHLTTRNGLGPAFDDSAMATLSDDLSTCPHPDEVKRLKDLVRSLHKELPYPENEVVGGLLELKPDNYDLAALKGHYARLASQMKEESLTMPTSWHLRALLHHGAGDYPAASKDYTTALQHYENEPSLQSLQAVCARDYGQLLDEKKQDYLLAGAKFRVCLAKAKSRLLKVDCLCHWATTCRKNRQISQTWDLLDKAQTTAQKAAISQDHPLRAVIHECRGWAAFDNWQLVTARDEFVLASGMRKKQERTNPRHKLGLIWNLQAQAMIEHYRGDQSDAVKHYTLALDKIDKASDDVPRKLLSELKTRRPNLRERLADCFLFGQPHDYPQAQEKLYEAIEATGELGFDRKALWHHVAALKAKKVIADLYAGDNTKQAKMDLEKLQRWIDRRKSNASKAKEKVYGPPLLVAQSLLKLRLSDNKTERATTYHELLDLFLTSEPSRQSLDLMLLVANTLATPDVLRDDEVEDVLTQLSTITEKVHGDARVSSRYFHGFYRGAHAFFNVRQEALSPKSQDSLKKIGKVVQVAAAELTQPKGKNIVSTRGGKLIIDEESHTPVNCRLFYLTIGISDYKHDGEEFTDLQCAANDAIELARTFKNLCYDKKTGRTSDRYFELGWTPERLNRLKKRNPQLDPVLIDEQATRANILEVAHFLTKETNANDLVIVSIAGHGKLQAGSFFFLTHDFHPKKSSYQLALSQADLLGQLNAIPCHVVLLLDACHSGKATTGRTVKQEVWESVEQVMKVRPGFIVMAASESSKTAREDPAIGHGYFTAAVLEGLQGKYIGPKDDSPELLPDRIASDPRITLHNLQYYVTNRVRELSQQQQHPVVSRSDGDPTLWNIPLRPKKSDNN